jgi:putative ABC transport system permease protein
MLILTGFAAAALLLALVGIYGTVAQSVAQRSQELGLRMALGASPGAAVRLIVGEGARLVAAGLLIGSFASIGLTRLMRGMLFEVSPLDPVVLLGAALTIAIFAMAACYLPANRATRVDPVVALRAE